MMTFTADGGKKVLIICLDRSVKKYRLVNIGDRTIASQQYDTREAALSALRRLEEEGRIKELKIFDEL